MIRTRGRTVIITTTAGTADITTAGITAGNLRRVIGDRLLPHNHLVITSGPHGTGLDVSSSICLRTDEVIE